MRVPKIWLQSFRSYTSKVVELGDVTIVVGENAVGKTTLLEALMLLATGSSFRASTVDEMVQLVSELGRVQVGVDERREKNGGDELEKPDLLNLEVMVNRGLVQGQRTQKMHFKVNGVKRRKKDFMGKLLAVCFRPEDMRLVEGSPSRRRSFLDEVLVQVHPEYAVSLATYEQTLRRLNKLLEHVKEGKSPVATLTFWNMQLTKHGELLQKYRQQLAAFAHSVPFELPFSLEYVPSIISTERLAQYQSRAIAAGHTLIGPHKDDFIVKLSSWRDEIFADPLDMSSYGSRGQQRLAVLWLKVVQLLYIQEHRNQRPLLLLDDIWSELDHQSQAYILPLLREHQTVITTTDPHLLVDHPEISDGATVLKL